MYAAARGAIDCVKVLLHAGASLSHVSEVSTYVLYSFNSRGHTSQSYTCTNRPA